MSITLSMLITNFVFGFPFYEGTPYLFVVIVSKVLFLVMILFSIKVVDSYKVLKTRKLIYLLLCIVLIDYFYSALSDIIYYYSIFDNNIIMTILFISLLSLIVFLLIFESEKEHQKQLKMQKNILRLENQEKIIEINTKNINELKKWKHENLRILNSLNYYIDHDIDKAKDIINNYSSQIQNIKLKNTTNNEFLDYLLLSKHNTLKENNITIQVFNTIKELPIDDTHFNIIIGNLIDNAIENCGKEKIILLNIGIINNYYFIKISNSIDNSILKENPELITSKEDNNNHGYGLKTINYLIKKYNGKISYEENNYEFTVKILIPKKR